MAKNGEGKKGSKKNRILIILLSAVLCLGIFAIPIIQSIKNDKSVGSSVILNTDGGSEDGVVILFDEISDIIPEKPGYAFEGWYADKEHTIPATAEALSKNGNLSTNQVYAAWSPLEFSINYHTNNGALDGSETKAYTVESGAVTLPLPQKSGYTFQGWYDNPEFYGPQVYSVQQGSYGNKDFYAKWSPYDINYQANGGTIPGGAQTTYDGSTEVVLPVPTKVGYDFAGWYTNPSFLEKDKVEVIPAGSTRDKQFYAKWNLHNYSVGYNLNGGSPADNPSTVTINDTVTLKNPQRTGYDFDGWYTVPVAGEPVKVTQLSGVSSDTTLKAEWTAHEYSITYNDGGDTNPNPVKYSIESEKIVLKPSIKKGYSFKQWVDSSNNVITEIPAQSTGNKILYGVWTVDSYTVEYRLNGGTNSAQNLASYSVDSGFTLQNASRNNYVFMGWYTDEIFSGEPVTKVPITGKEPENLVLYARFLQAYQITYYAGGNAAHTNPASFTEESAFTLTAPVRDGYAFTEWNTAADGSGEKYTEITKGAKANIVLFALWNPVTYSIEYYSDGLLTGTSTYIITDTVTLNAISKSGYKLAGWCLNPTFTDVPIKSFSGKTGDLKFYAKWDYEYYTITYITNNGSNVGNPATYKVDDHVVLTDSARVSYKFMGWFTREDFSPASKVTEIFGSQMENITLYAYFVRYYTITYYLDNGANSPSNPERYTELDNILFDVAYKTGYKFYGWYTDAGFANAITGISAGSMTESLFLYARFSFIYTVTYVLNGGINHPSNPDQYTALDDTITLNSPSLTGALFAAWKNASGVTVGAISKGSTGNLTLTANWDYIQYTITYHLNSGTNNPGNLPYYTYEYSYNLENPSKADNQFRGWYLDPGYTQRITSLPPSGVPRNLDIYAKFTPNNEIYGIVYTQIFGVSNPNPDIYVNGEIVALVPITGRTGYTFDFWSLSGSLTPVAEVGTQTGMLTLEAHWIPVNYEIQYEYNGGAADGNPATYTILGLSSLGSAVRLHYEFVSWHDNEQLTSPVSSVAAGATGIKKFYAQWRLKNYEIKYILSALDTKTAYYTYSATEDFVLEKGVMDASKFISWHTDASCTTAAVAVIAAGSYGTQTFYAKWEREKFTISYSLNGGELAANPAPMYIYDSNTPVILGKPSREGYDFVGWYTADAQTMSLQRLVTEMLYPIGYVMIIGHSVTVQNYYQEMAAISYPVTAVPAGMGGNLVFYARWSSDEYAINYELYGGQNNASNLRLYSKDSGTVALYDAALSGFTFCGWYADSMFTERVYSLPHKGQYAEITLHAYFERTYTIDYFLDGSTTIAGQPLTGYYQSFGTYTLLPASKSSYEFIGWYLTTTFTGSPVTELTFAFVSANANAQYKLILYPKLLQRYDIVYNLNMGTNNATNAEGKRNPEFYTVETNFTLLDASRAGHIFKGWYTNNDGSGNKITAINNTLPNFPSTLNLYAVFLPIIYVTYETNGGDTNHGNPASFTKDDSFTLYSPTRDGYNFLGWYRDANFRTDRVYVLNSNTLDVTKLYAKWETITYHIYYRYKNAHIDTDNPVEYTVESGEIVLLPYNVNYYTFTAWLDETLQPVSTIKNRTGDLILNATYTPVEYSITYTLGFPFAVHANPAVYTVESAVIFTAASVGGADFLGWFTSPSAINPVTGIDAGSTGERVYFAKWNVYKYGITYSLSVNETNDIRNPVEYSIESNITLYPAIKPNQTFIGWYSDPGFSTQIINIAGPMTGALTLYPRFSVTRYITYYLDDQAQYAETNNINNPTAFTELSTAITLLPAAKQYHTFEGWYDNALLQGSPVTVIPSGTTANIDLYPKWAPVKYDIEYVNADNIGTNVLTFTVFDAVVLKDADRSGYQFLGWFTNPDLSGAISTIPAGTHNKVTVYASWRLIQYSITYNYNQEQGATNSPDNASVYNVGSFEIILYPPVRTGYDFNGWSDDNTHGIVTSIPAGSIGNRSFTAQWSLHRYSITYHGLENVTVPAVNPADCTMADTVTLNNPQKDYYEFLGWYAFASFAGNAITVLSDVTENVDLYARWKAKSYNVQYVLESGANNHLSNPQTYTVEDNFTLNPPTKAEFLFLGWYLDANPYTNEITVLGNGDHGDKIIYARFAQSYSIEYRLDGGINSELNPLKYTAEFDVTLYAATKPNYKFLGWYDNQALQGAPITSLVKGTSGTQILYAKFVRVYNITYYADGGAHNNPAVYEQGETIILTDAVKSSFLFLGWYDNSEFTGEPYSAIAGNTGKDISLYARWGEWQGYIYYGEYPQSRLINSADIAALNQGIASGGIVADGTGYYHYNGAKYARLVAASTGNGYTKGEAYYFKVEPIRWKIIYYDNGAKTITLIADLTLDVLKYNNTVSNVTWDASSLRAWLESGFYAKAFSMEEQARLISMLRGESLNPVFAGSGGNAQINSSVTVLSIEETLNAVVNYGFSSDMNEKDGARQSKASDFALASGAVVDAEGNANWWLYTKGMDAYSAAYVGSDGRVYANGVNVTLDGLGIRPVITITLESVP